MTFKLKSGNKPSFKQIGSSPVKDMKTGSYAHSFENSPTKKLSDYNPMKVDPKDKDPLSEAQRFWKQGIGFIGALSLLQSIK